MLAGDNESGDDCWSGYDSDEANGGAVDDSAHHQLGVKLGRVKQWHKTLSTRCDDLNGVLARTLHATADASQDDAVVKQESTNIKQTASALLVASTDYFTEVLSHQRTWTAALQANEGRRKRLEEQLEALAKEHRQLERTLNQAAGRTSTFPWERQASGHSTGLGSSAEEDDSADEFFDARTTASGTNQSDLDASDYHHDYQRRSPTPTEERGYLASHQRQRQHDHDDDHGHEHAAGRQRTDSTTTGDEAGQDGRAGGDAAVAGGAGAGGGRVVRRGAVPQRPNNADMSMWSILKGCGRRNRAVQ